MKKLIGDKAFYKMVLVIMIPMVITNGITTFVGLLDNIMIGQLGTLPMSGVSIANQLLSVFNLAVFGAFSGPGIFSAQFYGKKDYKGVQNCFCFKALIGIIILLVSFCILHFFGAQLVNLYLTGNAEDTAKTLSYSLTYIHILMIGLPPFVLAQVYSSTLRETGDTVLPMVSTMISLGTNFVLNYLLIFGSFGFPRLGVAGAAIATVIARYVEFFTLMIISHKNLVKHPFMKGIYSHFRIKFSLVKSMVIKSFPLLCNEILWSTALAAINQSYSTRGIDAIAAISITTTLTSAFMIVCYAMGSSISIIIGQQLGANHIEEAYEMDLQLIFFNFMLSLVTGSILFSVAKYIPNLYSTTQSVKSIATSLMKISAFMMPVQATYYGAYFTLRAGGKTLLTFLFDSIYSTFINLSIAFILSRFTSIPIFYLYLIVQLADIPKAIIGITLIGKGIWLDNIVENV